VYRLNSHDEFQPPLPSDLTVLQIPLGDEMEFVPSEAWFETPGQSLAEALVMGASRALGIEDDELEGGFRTRSAEHADIDARGVIEVFLFDTTAGGAGFSSRVWEEFDAVCRSPFNPRELLMRYGVSQLSAPVSEPPSDSLNRHRRNRHEGLALRLRTDGDSTNASS